ncbi:beta subunit of fatty acid synthetase [Coemansia sp. RSA 2424]|nr:beta subunit of fatty acid synthetase [Coemansia sp. RSA 2424]
MTALAQIQLERGSVVAAFDVTADQASLIKGLARSFTADPAEILSAIELHAAFIQHCVDNGSPEDAIIAVFSAFCLTYDTATRDIHVIVQAQGLGEAAARRVLKGYFSAWSIVNSDTHCTWPVAPLPALFAAESTTELMALFGGQRGLGNCMQEAVWLFDVYRPLLSDFVSHMSAFLHCESQNKRVCSAYSKGFNVFSWLTLPDTMPDTRYQLSMAIALPLLSLTQMMHIVVLFKTLVVSPGELVKRFKSKSH